MVTQDTSLLHRSVRDNIVYGRPDATDDDMIAAARRAEAHEFIVGLADPKGRRGLRRARRRARRQAVGRPAPARRDRARDAQGRADPAARRGDQRARLRGRGRDPAEPLPADGRQDRRRDRAPAVDDRGDGPADRARPRAASSRRATTARCSRTAASTRGCGRTRAAASSATMPTRPRSPRRRPRSTPTRRREPPRKLEPVHIGHDRPAGADPSRPDNAAPTRGSRGANLRLRRDGRNVVDGRHRRGGGAERAVHAADDDPARGKPVGASERDVHLRADRARQRIAAVRHVAREARQRDAVTPVECQEKAVAQRRARVRRGRCRSLPRSARPRAPDFASAGDHAEDPRQRDVPRQGSRRHEACGSPQRMSGGRRRRVHHDGERRRDARDCREDRFGGTWGSPSLPEAREFMRPPARQGADASSMRAMGGRAGDRENKPSSSSAAARSHEPRRAQVLERGADRLEQRHRVAVAASGVRAGAQLGQLRAHVLAGESRRPRSAARGRRPP